MTRRRVAALTLCALFVVFFLSAFSLAAVHAHVHCYHDTCSVCQTIHLTESLLRQLIAGFAAILAAAFARVASPRVRAACVALPHPTLVSMKVKLTD